MIKIEKLLRFALWTETQPLVKLFTLSILFQGALVASLFWRNDALFYAGVVGSWCLIILFFVRQATVYGQRMLKREKGDPVMGYWEICKMWSPFALHFSSFALLTTFVGLANQDLAAAETQQVTIEMDDSINLGVE